MRRFALSALRQLLGAALLLAVTSSALGQGTGVPNAEESDPKSLGWMRGFTPAPDCLIMQPESDFFSFPKFRWTV